MKLTNSWYIMELFYKPYKLSRLRINTINDHTSSISSPCGNLLYTTKRRVTSPTLQHQLWQSPHTSPHTSLLPILFNSQQKASTCPSHKLSVRPLGLLHSGLPLSEITRELGLANTVLIHCSNRITVGLWRDGWCISY